ncbi:hypothetical protein V2S66_15425 [Streptomyces sp. V4-01]|uniref:Lipoprotein n=1 Tax=Actinacidiphila polyblastidii TaxID=3110430 RepID=A0ABU7PC23_9ACTN|nr:hypothetical protein [Streptomyces sp. V4-01]
MNSDTPLVRAGVLVAALVAATGLAGCASHDTKHPDPGAPPSGSAAPSGPATSGGSGPGTAAGRSPGDPGSGPPTQPLSAWPDKPFTDRTPFRWNGRPAAISAGYAAADFRAAMQRTWRLSHGATEKKQTFDGRSYLAFTDRLTNGGELLADVVGIEDAKGDLQQLTCDVYQGAARPAAFLQDCASLAYPNADPAGAAAWEEADRPRLDAMVKGSTAWAESPLFTAGGTSMFLRHSRPVLTSGGGRMIYELVVFGSGSGSPGGGKAAASR